MYGTIYIIKNKVNSKVYIGQTKGTIQDRLYNHKKPSRLKKQGSYKIYNAFNKYGVDNFYIEVLKDKVLIEDLNNIEIEYIEIYDSFNNGYNTTPGGDGSTIHKTYDITNIVGRYVGGESSVKIAEHYGVSHNTITRLLRKNNITTRENGNKLCDIDHSEFKTMYYNKKLSNSEIADHFKVHERTIRRWATKLGYESRNNFRNKYVSNL